MQAVEPITEIPLASAQPDIKPAPFWDRLITLLFVLAVTIPPAMLAFTWSRSTLEFENRRTEPWPGWPGWALQGMRAFAPAFEHAFNDRFGGRDALVHLNNIFQAVVLRKSPSEQVIIGKGNWLFVKGGWYGALEGYDAYPHATNEGIAKGIVARATAIEKLGISYRLLYSPDKHTIYPEYLPARVKDAAKLTRIDEVLSALPPDIRSHVIDLRQPLLEAKHERQVFLTTDSHWDSFGAWVGYAELARSLGLAPVPFPKNADELTTRDYAGDLARMMGADLFFRERDELPMFFLGQGAHPGPCLQPVFTDARYIVQKFECPGAPLGRAVFYRDSFGFVLQSYVVPLFRETIFVANAHFLDVEWLRQIKPDIFVDQIVERGLPNLAIQFPAFQEASFLPALGDISAMSNCSIANVTSDEQTGHPVRIIHGEVHLAGQAGRSPPERLWFLLQNSTGNYAAEMEPNTPELLSYFGHIDPYVFNLIAGGDELSPGNYSVSIVGKFRDQFTKCTTTSSHLQIAGDH
jgi:hypothetical protein